MHATQNITHMSAEQNSVMLLQRQSQEPLSVYCTRSSISASIATYFAEYRLPSRVATDTSMITVYVLLNNALIGFK